MSGSPYCFWGFAKTDRAKFKTLQLAKLLNDNEEVRNVSEALQILKRASAEEIIRKVQVLRTVSAISNQKP